MDKRRWIVLLISFNFAIIFVLSGFVYQKHLEIGQLHTEGHHIRALALTRVSEHVADMETALRLGQYAASPEVLTALGTRLTGRAAAARAALEKLPLELEETAALFSRMETYAHTLVRTAHAEPEHAAAELSQLLALSGPLALIRAADDLEAMAEAEDALAGFVPVFGTAAEDTPTVSIETARANVAAFTGLKESIFHHVGDHTFRARVDGGEFTVWVCKETGQVLWAANSRQARGTVLTAEAGLDKALAFLARNGYADMTLLHWQKEKHQVAASFAPAQDGVLLYPDAIQISVGLDNGRVTAFSAVGQTLRELPEPALTKEEARTALSASLAVEGADMALIPAAGGREALCFRFRARDAEGQAFLVYVNAETGRQQEIRLVVERETGVFSL